MKCRISQFLSLESSRRLDIDILPSILLPLTHSWLRKEWQRQLAKAAAAIVMTWRTRYCVVKICAPCVCMNRDWNLLYCHATFCFFTFWCLLLSSLLLSQTTMRRWLASGRLERRFIMLVCTTWIESADKLLRCRHFCCRKFDRQQWILFAWPFTWQKVDAQKINKIMLLHAEIFIVSWPWETIGQDGGFDDACFRILFWLFYAHIISRCTLPCVCSKVETVCYAWKQLYRMSVSRDAV